jgi:hypothetical protein
MPKTDHLDDAFEDFFTPISVKRKRLAETLTSSLFNHSMHIARRHYLPAEIYQNARFFAAVKRVLTPEITGKLQAYG